MHDRWRDVLAERQTRNLFRRRRCLDGAQGREVLSDGRTLINFSANDYLGLASHPLVVEAFKRGADVYGVGAGASHLISGHVRAHHALEEEIADFVGRQRALLFSTGYMANIGTIAAVSSRGSTLFADRLNHASLIDGCLLSRAPVRRYPHVDVGALAALLALNSGPGSMVITDGIFSMEGDLAPLPQLATVARETGACLMVDDAHGIGVLGQGGGGTLEHFGLSEDAVPILVGTLGKALGTAGAFVAGCDALIDYLVQAARTYIYTTAIPPAVAEATRASLRLARSEHWRRERLHELVIRFRNGARQLGLRLTESITPIQCVVLGGNADTEAAADSLLHEGLLVGCIRPPTVPVGTARLRITFSATHQDNDVDRLLSVLADLPSP